MKDSAAVVARTLAILREVTGDDDIVSDPDQPLLDSGLIDSLGIVSLIAALEETFGLVISPAELDRAAWATPRALVADVERRLALMGPSS
jgi:D-alanine--poly(phosphoribitol) ligase subunit 2